MKSAKMTIKKWQLALLSMVMILIAVLGIVTWNVSNNGLVRANAASAAESGLTMQEGASIRIVGNTGVRFSASITESQEASVDDYGIIMSDAETLSGAELTLDNAKGKISKANNMNTVTENGKIRFNAVLTNVKDQNLTRTYVARAFVTVGGTTYYTDAQHRSPYAVAHAAYNDGYTQQAVKDYMALDLKVDASGNVILAREYATIQGENVTASGTLDLSDIDLSAISYSGECYALVINGKRVTLGEEDSTIITIGKKNYTVNAQLSENASGNLSGVAEAVADPDTNIDPMHLNFSPTNVKLGTGKVTNSSLVVENDGSTHLKVVPTAGDPWWNGAVVNFTDIRENRNLKANGTYTQVKLRYKIKGGTNPEGLSLRILGVDGGNTAVNTGPDGTTDGYINLASVTETDEQGWVEATFDVKYANPQYITGLDFGVKGYTPTIYIDYIEFINETAVCQHTYAYVAAESGHTATCSKCNTTLAQVAHSGGTATCEKQATCEVCNAAYGEKKAHVGGVATCTAVGVCTECGEEYLPKTDHNFDNYVCMGCGMDVMKNVFGKSGVTITATAGTVAPAQDGSIAFSGAWWVNSSVSGFTIPTHATQIKLTMKSDGSEFRDGGVWHNITGTKATGAVEEATAVTADYAVYTYDLIGNQGEALTTLNLTVQNHTGYLAKVEFTIVEPDPDPDTNTEPTHLNFSSANVTLGECTGATSSLEQDVDGTTYLKVVTTAGEWWNGTIVNFTDNRENTNVKANGTYVKIKIRYMITAAVSTETGGLSFRLLGLDGDGNAVNTCPSGTDGYIELANSTTALNTWHEAEFDVKYANPQTITGLEFGMKGWMNTICIDYIEFLPLTDSDKRNDPVRLNFTEENFTLGESTSTSSSFGMELDGTSYLRIETLTGEWWNGSVVNFTDNRENGNVKLNGDYTKIKIRYKVEKTPSSEEGGLSFRILGVDGGGNVTNTCPGGTDGYIELANQQTALNTWIEAEFAIVYPYPQYITGVEFGVKGWMNVIYIDYIEFLTDGAHAHDFTYEYAEAGHTATCSCGKTFTTEHKGGAATCTEQAKCAVCGIVYGELAEHTGGTATCFQKAVCEVCGRSYGDTLSHNFDANQVCTACGLNVTESVFGKGVSIETIQGLITPQADGSLAFSTEWWVKISISGLTIPQAATEMRLTLKTNATSLEGVLYNNIVGATGNNSTQWTLTNEYQEFTIPLETDAGGKQIAQFDITDNGWIVYLLKVEFVVPEDPDTDVSATHLNFSEANISLGESTTATGTMGRDADGTTYLKVATQGIDWDCGSKVYFTDNRANTNIKLNGDYLSVKLRFKVSGGYNPGCLRFRVLGYTASDRVTETQTHFIDLLPLVTAYGQNTWIEATIAIEQPYVGLVTGLGFGTAGYTPTVCIDYIEFLDKVITLDVNGEEEAVNGAKTDGVLTSTIKTDGTGAFESSSIAFSNVVMPSDTDSLEITMKAPIEKDYTFTVMVDGLTTTRTLTIGMEYDTYTLALPKQGTAFTIAVNGVVIMNKINFIDSAAKMAYWGPVVSGNTLSTTDVANLNLYKNAGFNVFTINSPNSIGTPVVEAINLDGTATKAILDYGAANGVKIIVTDQVLQWLSHARIPLVANTGYALFQYVEGVGHVYFASGATLGATVEAIDGANNVHTVTVDGTATYQFASQAELNTLVYNRMAAYATHSAYYGVDLWDEPSKETFAAIGQLLDAIAYADKMLGVKTYPQQCLLPSYGFSSLSDFETYVTEYAQMITTHGNGIINSIRSDVYPLRNGKAVTGYTGNYIQKDYINCIQMLAKTAKAYNLDWDLTVQAYGHSSSAYRAVSEEGMKWQVALAYAFGAKNVSYYTFTCDTHGGYDSAIVTGTYTEGYTVTNLYTYVQKATAYAEAIGDVLRDYAYNGSTVKAVNKTLAYSSYKNYGYYYDSVSDDNVSGFSINSATYTAVLTQLKSVDGKYAYGLVNMLDPDKTNTSSVKVTLSGVTTATVYKYSTDGTNNITSETVTFTDGAYTFGLAAGEGIIILPA